MGIFSTRNNDGASGLAEPCSTIPLAERAKLAAEADRHGCDSVTEFVSAPGPGPSWFGFPPEKAGTN